MKIQLITFKRLFKRILPAMLPYLISQLLYTFNLIFLTFVCYYFFFIMKSTDLFVSYSPIPTLGTTHSPHVRPLYSHRTSAIQDENC